MVQLALVSIVLVLSSVCACSLHSPPLRNLPKNSGSESTGSGLSRRPQLRREQASLLQLSFGPRAVAEAQAEMASSQELPFSLSSASLREAAVSSSPIADVRGLEGFPGRVGPAHGAMLLERVANSGAEGNSSTKSVATRDSNKHSGGLVVFILGFILGAVVCGLLPILGYAVARAICKRIERGFAASDKASLGVDVDIGKLSVNLCEGYIVIHGLTVFNPPGYSAEYLLKAETVNVDIRMAKLVCSCFQTVQVEKIVFSGVDMLYDKSWSSSNINDVINAARVGGTLAEKLETNCKGSPTCTMRKVFFEDVVVRQPMAGKATLALAAADLDVQDFSAEVGESRLQVAAFEVLRRVLKTAAATLERHAVAVGAVGEQ